MSQVAKVVGIALIVGVALISVSKLELVTSYVSMIPEDSPEVRDALIGVEELESTQDLIIAVSGPPSERERFAGGVVGALSGLDSVVAVEAEFPVEFFEENWLLLLDPEEQSRLISEINEELRAERGRQNPLFADLRSSTDKDAERSLKERLHEILPAGGERFEITEDGRYLLIRAQPRMTLMTSIDELAAMIEEIDAALQEIERSSQVEYRLSGHMILALEEYESLATDLGRASLLALLLILLILVVATRRPAIIVACGVPLIVGMVLTLAVTQLVLGHLNMVSAFMLPALMGLGVDFGIHLHYAYDDRLRFEEPRAAMESAVRKIFPACFAAAATTAAGFVALLVSDFAGIKEYGVIAGVGIFLMLISTFVIAPILTPLLWRSPGKVRSSRDFISPRPLYFIAISGVFLVVAMMGLGSTTFENDFRDLRGELPTADFHHYLMEQAGQPFDPTLLLVDSSEGAEDARRVAAIARQEKFAPSGERSDVGRVVGISDFLPHWGADSEEMQRLRRQLDRFPDSQDELIDLRLASRAEAWEREDIPESIRRRLTTRSGRDVVAVFSRGELGADSEFAVWQSHIGGILAEAADEDIESIPVDKWAVVHRMLQLIVDSFWPMVWMAILLVTLVSMIVLRGIRRSALVLAMVAVGVLAFSGAVGWLGLSFNLFNIVVLPSIFGIAIDNAIQLVTGFEREDFAHVLNTRWRACLTSTATTMAGFGAMIIATHQGVASLGEVAIVGLASIFVATSILLPAIIALGRSGDSDVEPNS